jgi:membrane protein
MPDFERQRERAEEHVPSSWQEIVTSGRDHNLPILAAGLAFFGLISIGPAIAVGFAALQFIASPEAADAVIELLEDTPIDQFGLVDIMRDMEDEAGQFAGFSLLFLLWPATTLASGWTRALNDIFELDVEGPSGLKGRLRGIAPGSVLLVAVFLVFLAATFGTALLGEGVLLALAIVPGAIAVQMGFNLVIYRYLPSHRLGWGELWRGAGLATAGVVVGTLGFVALLTFSQDFADEYPEQLVTAIVLGFWLYVTNAALLAGAEYNATVRRERDG